MQRCDKCKGEKLSEEQKIKTAEKWMKSGDKIKKRTGSSRREEGQEDEIKDEETKWEIRWQESKERKQNEREVNKRHKVNHRRGGGQKREIK